MQTCDTDLNQHARRDYISLETAEFIHHFQQGEVVPKLQPETMIDLMVEVLSNPSVHLRAAAGYKKTAVAVNIDNGGADLEICREAGDFWRELGVRPKVNAEVARVRAEVAAGRLAWTYESVVNLMAPYQKSKDEDRLLGLLHDAGHCDLAEERWADAGGMGEGGGSESDSGSESDGGLDAGAELAAEGAPAVAGGEAHETGPGVMGGEADATEPAVAGPSRSQSCAPSFSPRVANLFHRAEDSIASLQAAKKELQSHGLLRAAHLMNVELEKENRRLRALAREDAGVVCALEERSQLRAEQENQLVRRAEEAHKQALTVKRIRASIDDAERELRQKRQAIQDLENVLEARHALKTFTPELLGQGLKRAGGAKGQRARFDVLDRLAHLGVGLSPEQKNDWAWFKGAWDAKMVIEHDGDWPLLFAGYVQQVLDDMAKEAGSNAFSNFVHRETLRCLSDQIALRVPAAQR